MSTQMFSVAIGVLVVLEVFLLCIGILETRKKTYKGKTVLIEGSRDLLIDAEKVFIEASSTVFFFLRRENGEVVYGVPTNTKYFVAERREIPGGRWLFTSGTATVSIMAEKEISVKTIDTHRGCTLYLYSFLPFLTGVIVFMLYILFHSLPTM